MPTKDSPQSNRQRSRRFSFASIGAMAFGFLLLLMSLLLGGKLAWNAVQRSAVQAKLRLLDASKKPIDDAGVQSLYASQTSPQSTHQWNQLLQELNAPEFIQELGLAISKPIPLRGTKWNEEGQVRPFFQKTAELRRGLRNLAIGSPPVFFPLQFHGFQTDFPHLLQLRKGAQLLYVEGGVSLRDGDGSACYDSIRALFGCSDVCSAEPCFVSKLTSFGLEKMALSLTQEAVEQNVLNQVQLKELLTIIQKRDSIEKDWPRTVQGERGLLLASLSELEGKQSFFSLLTASPATRATALDLIERLEMTPTADLDTFKKGMESVQFDGESEMAKQTFRSLDTMALMGLPPFTAGGQSYVTQQMRRRIALLAIAIRIHQIKSGSFPESLEKLSIERTPVQKWIPIGGRPFGYRLLGPKKEIAVVWGFFPRAHKETPSEPPLASVPAGNESDDANREWVWQLK